MSRKLWIGLGVIAVIAVVFGGTCVSQYNRLVSAEEQVDEAWAQVDNVLQRRADLIPNLVQTVKGYASHERAIFTEVADARARMLAARDPADKAAADQQLTSALGRLLAIAENYPQLRASENFHQLQDELAGTENRIAVERKRYNEMVRTFNQRIRSFPTSVTARLFGFASKQYFQAQEGAREVPKVDFGGEATR